METFQYPRPAVEDMGPGFASQARWMEMPPHDFGKLQAQEDHVRSPTLGFFASAERVQDRLAGPGSGVALGL